MLTVVVDNMGNAQNVLVGGDEMKAPREILEYRFETSGGDGPGSVEWKVTGNLDGEEYVDKVRGPLNEGGLFAERMGYHQPGAPADRFVVGGGVTPMKGIDQPGVGFWTAEMELDIPKEKWDVPLSFEFPAIDPSGSGAYRAVLWVNGFRKCISLRLVPVPGPGPGDVGIDRLSQRSCPGPETCRHADITYRISPAPGTCITAPAQPSWISP